VAPSEVMPDNNIVEQDHRRIKRLIRPGLGFGGFWTAR
jgi:transposase, IS6 family